MSSRFPLFRPGHARHIPLPEGHPPALATTLVAATVFTFGIAGCGGSEPSTGPGRPAAATPSLLMAAAESTWLSDPTLLVVRASHYDAPEYDPAHWGYVKGTFDDVLDYSQDKLKIAIERTEGLDRKKALQSLYQTLTRGLTSDRDRVIAVANFVRLALRHSAEWQPMFRQSEVPLAVSDPLVLLQLGEGRCGHANRLAADILTANGYETRILQVNAHQTAEVQYDGKWHLLEANLLGDDHHPFLGGEIPSVSELCRSPELIDRLPLAENLEPFTQRLLTEGRPLTIAAPYPSTTYCNFDSLPARSALYYVKNARSVDETGLLYGWNRYLTIPANDVTHRPDLTNHLPSTPPILSVQTGPGRLRLRWMQSEDADDDLAGYYVTVDKVSRGWNYAGALVEPNIEQHMSSRFTPSMHGRTTRLPQGRVARIFTQDTWAAVDLPTGVYYVSVVPIDRYGMRIGRQHGFMSEELRIRIRSPWRNADTHRR